MQKWSHFLLIAFPPHSGLLHVHSLRAVPLARVRGICIALSGSNLEDNPYLLLMEGKLTFAGKKCMTLLDSIRNYVFFALPLLTPLLHATPLCFESPPTCQLYFCNPHAVTWHFGSLSCAASLHILDVVAIPIEISVCCWLSYRDLCASLIRRGRSQCRHCDPRVLQTRCHRLLNRGASKLHLPVSISFPPRCDDIVEHLRHVIKVGVFVGPMVVEIGSGSDVTSSGWRAARPGSTPTPSWRSWSSSYSLSAKMRPRN
jgi:hypothetical protein